VIPFIPLESLLIETDSPDQALGSVLPLQLVPSPIDSKINDPSQLWHVANRVAIAIGKEVDEVIQLTTENAKRAYRIDL
jgi:Tat protein secretion system quality control protein TatD with DNase activity